MTTIPYLNFFELSYFLCLSMLLIVNQRDEINFTVHTPKVMRVFGI